LTIVERHRLKTLKSKLVLFFSNLEQPSINQTLFADYLLLAVFMQFGITAEYLDFPILRFVYLLFGVYICITNKKQQP